METAKPAEATESDSELHSLVLAKAKAEIKSLNSQTFKNRSFGILCVVGIICGIHFYGLLLPTWQVSWNNKFFGNIDAIAETIDNGSNRIGSEIGGIKNEMVDMKGEMVDFKTQVVGSMNLIGQTTDYQMRVMNGQFGGMRQDIRPSNMMRDMIPW